MRTDSRIREWCAFPRATCPSAEIFSAESLISLRDSFPLSEHRQIAMRLSGRKIYLYLSFCLSVAWNGIQSIVCTDDTALL
jgi:hypothetical protein